MQALNTLQFPEYQDNGRAIALVLMNTRAVPALRQYRGGVADIDSFGMENERPGGRRNHDPPTRDERAALEAAAGRPTPVMTPPPSRQHCQLTPNTPFEKRSLTPVDRPTKKRQARFRSAKCGHTDNVDANAARNHLLWGTSAKHKCAVERSWEESAPPKQQACGDNPAQAPRANRRKAGRRRDPWPGPSSPSERSLPPGATPGSTAGSSEAAPIPE